MFDQLTALTILSLYDNDLTELPAGVFDQLTKLETLHLRNNQLSDLPAGVFEKLTELTELTLNDNPGTDDFVPTAMAAATPATIPTSGGAVVLDAAGSGGAWGANVTYAWALTDPSSGVTVTYDPDAASAMTTAAVPGSLTDGSTLTFTLTVTGRGGTTYIDTDTADVGVGDVSTDALVDNWDVGADSSNLSVSANDRGQRFRTGNNPRGYVLTSIDIDMTAGLASGDFTVSLWSATNLNLPDTVLATFVNPGNLSTDGTKTFTAPADTHLVSDTRYIITFEYTSGDTPRINTRNTTAVSSSSASGWSLDRYVLKSSGGDWAAANQVQAIRIRIFGNLSNSTPGFANDSETRSFDETIGDAAVSTASDIGAVVTATDADGDTLEYTLEGTDSSKFTIDSATGQIKTKVGEKYSYEDETSYEVTVKADDTNGGTDTVDVTLNVSDLDEAPVAPAAPSVSATSGSTTSLDVSWSAPDNTGRPAIDSYDLRYRQGTGGSWTNGPQDETGTSASIGSLTAGTSHQVQVRATNDEGDSPMVDGGVGIDRQPVQHRAGVCERLGDAALRRDDRRRGGLDGVGHRRGGDRDRRRRRHA